MRFKVALFSTLSDIVYKRVKIAAISLDEITSSKSRLDKNSLNCSTSGSDNFVDNTYVYTVTCGEKESKVGGHKVSIHLLDDPTQLEDKSKLKVQLNCSCDAFLYQGAQYNLKQKDALYGDSRGELVAPKVRDPVRVNYGCKHIFAAVRSLLDKLRKQDQVSDLELPEEDEKDETELMPSSITPFKDVEAEEEKEEEPLKTFVFKKKQVSPLLLPDDVDSSDLKEEGLDEETVKEEPKLFEREEKDQGFSTFRPKKKEDDEGLDLTEDEEDIVEEDEIEKTLPSKPKSFMITPTHDDLEDQDDANEVEIEREKNRNNRLNKIKTLFNKDEDEAEEEIIF